MRSTALFISAAILASAAAPSKAQDLAACMATQDAAKRLACFEAAVKTPANAAPGAAPVSEPWTVVKSISPIDGLTNILATKSDGADSFHASQLMLSCADHKTGLGVASRMITGSAQVGGRLKIVYRIDAAAPVTQAWPIVITASALQGEVAYPDPTTVVAFIGALPANGKIAFDITDYQGAARAMSFDLSGLDAIRADLAGACKWPKTP